MLTLTWKQSGGGSRDNKLDSSEGNGKHPPGTAFIPTPETELGLNGSICWRSGLEMAASLSSITRLPPPDPLAPPPTPPSDLLVVWLPPPDD